MPKPFTTVLAHIHTYVKYYPNQFKRRDLFKCNDPGCRHYAERSLIEGKYSLCNDCGAEFILDRDALRRVRPKCLMCSDTKRGKEARIIKSIVDAVDLEKKGPSDTDDPGFGGLEF